jgi:signal transduction histidine kinase
MGRWLQLSSHRTVAAFVLTAVAVTVPSAAWYVAGMHKVEREAHLAERAVYHQSYKKAVVLAERLATRLELLREKESRRPFYHFQNLYHDPKGAAEGASISVSPLAQGPTDPLIEAHFQVDEEGRLTLPTLNDEFPELGLHADEGEQCALLMALEELAYFCTLEEGGTNRTPPVFAVVAGDPADGDNGEGGHTEVMSERAWRQHLEANALYADLKYGRPPGSDGHPPSLGDAGEGRVEIEVGPYTWRTLPVGGEPSLVAVREVETPAGVWSQGFVISRRTVEQYLESASVPAGFVPLDPAERTSPPGEVLVPVEGTFWGVALDVSTPLAEAVSSAHDDKERFLRFFLLGALAAAVAGLLVVAMVGQSERLAQQRAQFAASAAHELRTPLAGLRLYGEMLAEGLGNPARARDYARRLAGEAERLGRVVTNVLSFTRLERGSLSVHPEPGDLAAAVEEACQRHRPALEGSGAELELDLDRELPPVTFDRDAVAHILQNLLDNAEKYTRGVEERTIRVGLGQAGERALLTVADNGEGIPESLRHRLFRPFTRGDHGSDATEGLGLGLVLVKLLTEAQGGRVTYRDAPGGGALFEISLPLAG